MCVFVCVREQTYEREREIWRVVVETVVFYCVVGTHLCEFEDLLSYVGLVIRWSLTVTGLVNENRLQWSVT